MSERTRLSAVRAEIGMALARQDTLRGMLHTCAEAMVRHLDAAFAPILTLQSEGPEIELQASAGMYTRLDGRYNRIPFGQFKIGLIAQERKAYLTNEVQDDSRIDDKDWARNEKMISFAGYPLVIEDRIVGVMGMFSQKLLTESTLNTLSFLADGIAQGIGRKHAEDRLQLLLDVTNQVVSNLQLHDLLRAISASIRRVMHCDLVSVCLPDSDVNRLQTFVLDFPESKGFIREEFFTPIEGSLSGSVFSSSKLWNGKDSDILQLGLKDEAAIPEGLKTGCILPLVSRNRVLGVLCLGRREENGFSQDDIGFLTQVASQISIAVENVSAYSEIAHARAELEKALGETKRRTEALRRSEGYLAEAQELSHTGSFGWDVSSGEIYWSRETFRIFECEPTAKVTLELVVQRTHPEDRSAVQQLIERVSRERTKFDFEHRLLMPDG